MDSVNLKQVYIRPIQEGIINAENEKPKIVIFINNALPERINIEYHKHPLAIQTYNDTPLQHYCDSCCDSLISLGYRCSEGCDYDYCFRCVGVAGYSR